MKGSAARLRIENLIVALDAISDHHWWRWTRLLDADYLEAR
jgi:hypothetical protein